MEPSLIYMYSSCSTVSSLQWFSYDLYDTFFSPPNSNGLLLYLSDWLGLSTCYFTSGRTKFLSLHLRHLWHIPDLASQLSELVPRVVWAIPQTDTFHSLEPDLVKLLHFSVYPFLPDRGPEWICCWFCNISKLYEGPSDSYGWHLIGFGQELGQIQTWTQILWGFLDHPLTQKSMWTSSQHGSEF